MFSITDDSDSESQDVHHQLARQQQLEGLQKNCYSRNWVNIQTDGGELCYYKVFYIIHVMIIWHIMY